MIKREEFDKAIMEDRLIYPPCEVCGSGTFIVGVDWYYVFPKARECEYLWFKCGTKYHGPFRFRIEDVIGLRRAIKGWRTKR